MPILTETDDQNDFKNGRKFSCYFYTTNIIENDSFELAFVTGEKNVKITRLEIVGTSSFITWYWFANSQVTKDPSEDNVLEIPLNQTVQLSSDVQLMVNPTVVTPGVALNSGVDSMGEPSIGNMYKLLDVLIDEDFATPKNTCNRFAVQNRHSLGDQGKANIGVKVSYSVMKDPHG